VIAPSRFRPQTRSALTKRRGEKIAHPSPENSRSSNADQGPAIAELGDLFYGPAGPSLLLFSEKSVGGFRSECGDGCGISFFERFVDRGARDFELRRKGRLFLRVGGMWCAGIVSFCRLFLLSCCYEKVPRAPKK